MGMTAGGPDLIQDGLVLCLDAGDRNSYQSGSLSWFDLSGNNNSGSLVNGPTFNTGSLGSIVFDGVNDYVNMGTSSTFQPSTITFSMWVKRTATWGAGSCLFWAKPNSNYTGSGFYVEPVAPSLSNYTNIVCNGWPNYFQLATDGNTTFPLNTPIYFCFTLSGGVGAIYINGVSKTITTVGTPAITSTSDIKYIMSNSPGYGVYTPGNIYTTQIYNRALSATEVLQNYNAQKSRFGL